MTWAGSVETHTGAVLFIGDLAVKVRKPVRFSFVDLTTPALRRHAAEEEVRLNRRLAPDVYRGVGQLVLPDGAPEPVVVMRRLPASRRLAALVTTGAEGLDVVVDEIADTLVAFHASCSPRDDVGDRDHLATLWDDVAAVLGDAPHLVAPDELRQLLHGAHDYLTGCADLFAARRSAGRVRDGHGDLLADDIFVLDDGVRILDCLEFDERLRCGDVLLDVAMLAMDLERLGASALARRLLDRYETAATDRPPRSLEHFFLGYRAAVRAKVTTLRWTQGDEAAALQVPLLFALATRHIDAARPALVLVGGLPGSGKTTVARAIAEDRGWSVLSTDVVRRDITTDGDRYSTASRAAVYDELLARAGALLGHGESVVLDGTWQREEWRSRAREVARRRRAQVVEIRCEVDEVEAVRRLRERTGDASEATADVRAELAPVFAVWPQCTRVQTGGDALDVVRRARPPDDV